jgi:hypothetical protein
LSSLIMSSTYMVSLVGNWKMSRRSLSQQCPSGFS